MIPKYLSICNISCNFTILCNISCFLRAARLPSRDHRATGRAANEEVANYQVSHIPHIFHIFAVKTSFPQQKYLYFQMSSSLDECETNPGVLHQRKQGKFVPPLLLAPVASLHRYWWLVKQINWQSGIRESFWGNNFGSSTLLPTVPSRDCL